MKHDHPVVVEDVEKGDNLLWIAPGLQVAVTANVDGFRGATGLNVVIDSIQESPSNFQFHKGDTILVSVNNLFHK